jgi:hypothetical protein
MTTYVEARDAIVSYFDPAWATAFPNVPVFYENTTQVDLDSVGASFVTVGVDYTDSKRLDIDPAPATRTWGEVILRLFVKEGGGIRSTLAMQDTLTGLMKYRKLGGVTLDCPTPGRKQARDGWQSIDLRVPFYCFQ